MHITIIGATGFIGSNLTRFLLDHTSHRLRLVAPDIDQDSFSSLDQDRVEYFAGSVLDPQQMGAALRGTDVVVYLVHMMGNKNGDYADLEAQAADIVGRAARQAGVEKLIYMSGLGSDDDVLSKHLKSRHTTGDIFRELLPNVIEFRASMVIGQGSISFEIVRSLVHKLPILLLPRWVITRTQPIGLDDVLRYLTAGIEQSIAGHEIVEIGGPAAMSYRDFLRLYARSKGLKRYFWRIKIIPAWLAAWWLSLFMPQRNARVGRAMVDSFRNEMVVTNHRAEELFPEIAPRPVEESF